MGQGSNSNSQQGGAGAFQAGQMGPNPQQMPAHLQNIMRNGGSIAPNIMEAGHLGGSPVRPGGFGPQWGRPGSQSTPMPQQQGGVGRQQFRDARQNFHDARDQFRSMEPGQARRDARGDFIAARDQFRDTRDQFRGQQLLPPGAPNPLIGRVQSPNGFVPSSGGGGPRWMQSNGIPGAAGAFGNGGQADPNAPQMPNWLQQLLQRRG